MQTAQRRSIDSVALYEAINAHREALGLSWRETIYQITGGVSTTLGARLRNGQAISGDMLGSILCWLGEYDIRKFLLAFAKGRRYVAAPGGPPEAG